MRPIKLALSAALLAFSAGAAHANIIGSAVTVTGNTVDGGTTSNPIDFYIPLSRNASGFYGVGNTGRTVDSCSTSSFSSDRCGNNYLGMFLEFEGASAGSHLLSLQFTDLDLVGVNDPYYFFETLSVYSLNSAPTYEFISSQWDPLVTFANHVNQTLSVGINNFAGGNLYFGLLFQSSIHANGTFYNTPESLIATLKPVAVPEPGTLSLLGAGLIAMAFVGRRRKLSAA